MIQKNIFHMTGESDGVQVEVGVPVCPIRASGWFLPIHHRKFVLPTGRRIAPERQALRYRFGLGVGALVSGGTELEGWR